MLPGILHKKIIPPPKHARILPRPRVTASIKQALEYRLTILQAEAGYGKSTALTELAETVQPLAWYQVNEEDNDPLVFLMHICHAFLQALPDLPDLPLQFLGNWDVTSQGPLPWHGVVDQIIIALSAHLDTPTLLVIDDSHLVTTALEFPQRRQVESLDALFDMLAREVFERQPSDMRDFVLEPGCEAGKSSAFIMRDGTMYRLQPGTDFWFDATEFADTAREVLSATPPDPVLVQRAVSLYPGEYLPGTLYETWAAEERERLSTL